MSEPVSPNELHNTAAVQSLLERIQKGDSDSVQILLNATAERLRVLAKRIGTNIPAVKRFEQTDDLLQNSLIRLWKSLEKNHPATPIDFYRLAATIMRRELIDISRHYFGALGDGANLAKTHPGDDTGRVSPIENQGDETSEPFKLSQWTEFHEYVEGLSDEEKELFDLLWYQGLTLGEAAQLTGHSERTMRRRWKNVRLVLYQQLMHTDER